VGLDILQTAVTEKATLADVPAPVVLGARVMSRSPRPPGVMAANE